MQKIFVCALVIFQPIQSINISLLKAVHAIVPPAYSPVQGLAFLEKGIVRQWYELSPYCLNKQLHELDKVKLSAHQITQKAIETARREFQEDSMQHLLREMFHVIGETCNVTRAPDNPVTYFQPEHIGTILKTIAQQDTAQAVCKEDLAEELKQKLVAFELKNKQNNEKFKSRKFNKFTNHLINALDLQKGSGQIYPADTVQSILLSYMLAKSQDRSDLQAYFRAFLADKDFILPDQRYTHKDIEHSISSQVDTKSFTQVSDLICAHIYRQKYDSALPSIITNNQQVTYKKIMFPDCIETVVRNLVNSILYVSDKFDFDQDGMVIRPEVQQFYQTDALHKDPFSIQHVQLHQDWAQLMQNLNGVSYRKLCFNGKKIDKMGDGFIPIQTGYQELLKQQVVVGEKMFELPQIQIANKTYLLVPDNLGLYCVDMRPDISNIIVVLNYIFNLNLYDSVDQRFTQDFASKYFALVCKAFNWQVHPSVIADLDTKYNDIHFEIKSQKGSFYMYLISEHGYLASEEKKQTDTLRAIDEQTPQSTVAQMLMSGLVHYKDLPVAVSKSCLFKNCIATDFNKRSQVAQLMIQNWSSLSLDDKKYLKSMFVSFAFAPDYCHIRSIIWACDKYPALDLELCCAVRDMMLFYGLKNNKRENIIYTYDWMLQKGFLNTESIDTILLDIHKEINSVDFLRKFRSLRLLKDMITKGCIGESNIDEIWEIIEKTYKINDCLVRSESLDVLTAMIQKGFVGTKSLDKIWEFINRGIVGQGFHVRYKTLCLLSAMIEQELLVAADIDQIWAALERCNFQTGIGQCNFQQKYDIKEAHLILMGTMVKKGVLAGSYVNKAVSLLANIAHEQNLENKKRKNAVYSSSCLIQFYDNSTRFNNHILNVLELIFEQKLVSVEHADQIILCIQSLQDRSYEIKNYIVSLQRRQALSSEVENLALCDRSNDVKNRIEKLENFMTQNGFKLSTAYLSNQHLMQVIDKLTTIA